MNISAIASKAAGFRARLDRVKRDLGPQNFEWYRYDSLANLEHMERLLTGRNRELDLTHPVLDIGCADGDLAFFLESLGAEVTAVDYPVTNHNHMAGVRRLKEALGSRVEILATDIDSQFALAGKEFGVAFILGAIYHLKNPLYLLEMVSKHARHAVLSTRIARHMPGIGPSLKDVSVAYLLGEDELNQDNSNYWIFTEASFRQMLRRTNWGVWDLLTLGDTASSDPIHTDRDERVFCFARSSYALANVELLEGWHDAEGNGWRWTKQEFAARVSTPTGASKAVLRMKLYLSPDLLSRHGSLTITPNGETFRENGYHEVLIDLGPQDGTTREVRFQLDHAIPPDAEDNRERGIIVHSLEVL